MFHPVGYMQAPLTTKGEICGSHLHEYAVDGDGLEGRTTHVWGCP